MTVDCAVLTSASSLICVARAAVSIAMVCVNVILTMLLVVYLSMKVMVSTSRPEVPRGLGAKYDRCGPGGECGHQACCEEWTKLRMLCKS